MVDRKDGNQVVAPFWEKTLRFFKFKPKESDVPLMERSSRALSFDVIIIQIGFIAEVKKNKAQQIDPQEEVLKSKAKGRMKMKLGEGVRGKD